MALLKRIGATLAFCSALLLGSCTVSGYGTDAVYGEPEASVTFSTIVEYGTPVYWDGVLGYYRYGGACYYPYALGGRYYFRPMSRPMPRGWRFRPEPGWRPEPRFGAPRGGGFDRRPPRPDYRSRLGRTLGNGRAAPPSRNPDALPPSRGTRSFGSGGFGTSAPARPNGSARTGGGRFGGGRR